jgi:hypothetical protein
VLSERDGETARQSGKPQPAAGVAREGFNFYLLFVFLSFSSHGRGHICKIQLGLM